MNQDYSFAPGQSAAQGGVPAPQAVCGQPYASAPQAVCGQPYASTPQATYGQPYAPAPYPAYGQPVYAPPFALRPARDPRLIGAGKTFNCMCLLVLLQSAAAFLWEMVLLVLSALSGVNIYTDTMAFQWLSAALVPLSTALPFFLYLLIGRKDPTEYLRFEKVGFFTALLCVAAGLGICLLGNFPAFFIQDMFSGIGYEPMEDFTAGGESIPLLVLEMLSTAVLVPVMEEFAFRGVLLSALRKYGAGFAIVGSALVFSLVHLDFSNVVFAFISGLVFGWLYVRTGNLWITICIHALNNGLAVLDSYGEFLFGLEISELLGTLTLFVPIAVGLLAAVLLAVLRKPFFARRRWDGTGTRPLAPGESASCIVRSPLFWVVVSLMLLYTLSLFLN